MMNNSNKLVEIKSFIKNKMQTLDKFESKIDRVKKDDFNQFFSNVSLFNILV